MSVRRKPTLELAPKIQADHFKKNRTVINRADLLTEFDDMATKLEVARQFMLHTARLCAAGIHCGKEASIAKLFASEMAEKVCSDALQIHGGYGYVNNFAVERYCRNVCVTKIYEGSRHIQKLIITRSL